MGIWPFGREPADVELASRVVTAPARDGVTVRGKLTLHFAEPQTQAAADDAVDRCATLTESILREALDHAALVGGEEGVVAELLGRLPSGIPAPRLVEIAAVHVVGNVISAQPRRPGSSASMRAVPSPPGTPKPSSGVSASRAAVSAYAANAPAGHPFPLGEGSDSFSGAGRSDLPPLPAPRSGPSAGAYSHAPEARGRQAHAQDLASPRATTTPIPGTAGIDPVVRVAPSSAPQAGPSASAQMKPRRVSSGRMRAISSSLLVGRGAAPQAIGASLAPIVRDAAGRLLVGVLRSYDLVVLRGHALDADSAEALASLVPLPDGPAGDYEMRRASELARWQTTLGTPIVASLRHEVRVAIAFMALAAFVRAEVSKHLANVIVEALCAVAFPDEAPALELGRYEHTMEPTVGDELTARIAGIVGAPAKRSAMSAALAPLLAAVEEELGMSAALVRQASGIG